MFSRWIVTNITSASVTTFLAFLAGIISLSVYCRSDRNIGVIYGYILTFNIFPLKFRYFYDVAACSQTQKSPNFILTALRT
jgi:hypothetical protein